MGKNITLNKREKGRNTISSMILRVSSGEEGEGTKIVVKKVKIEKMGRGRMSSCRELYIPLQIK